MPGPRLSVIVLTRNRRLMLRGCLESLFAQSPPGRPHEIIVVDDGSSDGTGDLVRDLASSHPELSYSFQAHAGIAAARNAGIRRASGELVAIVADDYLLAPDYGRTILRFFREHPGAAVVRFKIVPSGREFFSGVLHAYHEASVRRRLAQGTTFVGYGEMWRRFREGERVSTDHGLEAAGGAAFRREVFDRVGLFDEAFARVEDTEFTGRLLAHGIPVHYFPFHEVRHRYGFSLGPALASAFLSGRFRWRFRSMRAPRKARVLSLVGLGLTMQISALYWASWRAWQTGSFFRFLLYLPFFLLIELSVKSGFLYGALGGRGEVPRAPAGGR